MALAHFIKNISENCGYYIAGFTDVKGSLMSQIDQMTPKGPSNRWPKELKANSNALRQYKKTISLSLSKIQREVLVGTLLGDASMPLDRGRPELRVQFAQTIPRENYIWHLYDIFKNFVGTPPRVKNIRRGGARDRQCIRFLTYRHPDFQFYDDLFYPVDEVYHNKCRKKRVPTNIHEVLTPRALAYWFIRRRHLYVQ